MNKYRYLIQNTLLFAFSGVIVKVLGFFMLPIYTGVLTTADYGIAEFFVTSISLFTPIFSLSIAEAVVRFMLARDADRKSIFTVGTLIVLLGSLMLFILRPALSMASESFNLYFYDFLFMYFASAFEGMVFKFAKGMEKVKECAINAVVIIVTTIITNILCLLVFKIGLRGYLLASTISHLVSAIYLICVCKAWRYFRLKAVNKKIAKEMLSYSIPFIPTGIAWWINSAFDKYMLVFMLGNAANGLFSAASKLPATINIVTSVFTQAWQISGVKEYGDAEYEKFFTNVYNFYNAIMVLAVAVLTPLTPIVAKFLFSGEFYNAWVYAPVLYISTLFSGLTGVLASVFYAVKETKILMRSTLVGAAVNVVLNYVMIKTIGIQGAGIATMIGFGVVWAIRFMSTRKYIHIRINVKKTVVMYLILVAQIIIMLMQIKGMYIITFALTAVIVVMNISDYKSLIMQMLKKVRGIVSK